MLTINKTSVIIYLRSKYTYLNLRKERVDIVEKKTKQQRYDEKHGLVSKSYKLPKNVTDEFKMACEKVNISQSKKLKELMYNFIREVDEI